MTGYPGRAEIEALAAELAALQMPENLGAFAARAAERHGDAVAADFFQQGLTLSYREIHARSNRIAASLLARGHRKGAHVAVMLPNGPAALLVWFALMKLGAVIVPVNTAYGGKELDFILNQSDAEALIIGRDFLPAFEAMTRRPEALADPIVVDGADAGALEAGGPLEMFAPPYPVAATDLASLQYTSGTTGFPKGCMLSQDYWLLLGHSIGLLHRARGCERLFFWAPFFYMDGQWSFLSAMSIGARAIIASKMSLSRFLDWIRETRADYCVLPEPILKAVPPRPDDGDLPLKYVHAFGWRPAARAEAERRFNLIARDSFGMTEVGPALICPVDAQDKLAQASCGVAAPFRETRVVDEDGRECPPGTPGELQIRGRAIMLGYYKRPDANRAAFDGAWLRTGDLFVKDEDGYHRIVGRLKDMIKRAGENISASEVEAVLREAPEVAEAAAIAVPDPLRREEVMVLVKLADGVTMDDFPPAALSAHAAQRLAAFKRPRYLAYVPEFPRTATGKIAKARIGADSCPGPIFDLTSAERLSEKDCAALFGGG